MYAAGDICIKPLRQVVTATADGALAATDLEKYVAEMQEKTGLYTKDPVQKDEALKRISEKEGEEKQNSDRHRENVGLFSEEMQSQLMTVFEKMDNPLILQLYLDKRPISQELLAYMKAFASLTKMLTVEVVMEDASSDVAPYVKICRMDGSNAGLTFHGVPGGHECTSFVLGLYNVSGPGQPLDEEMKRRIMSIKKIDIKILVTLTCTMCPELVIAAMHIAAINPEVTTEIYDAHHFEHLRNKYKVMSVPCMVINDTQVMFGKKNMQQLLEILEGL